MKPLLDKVYYEEKIARLETTVNRLWSQRALSAWFWFPIHTAHWKLWRLETARLRSTRARFRELAASLECQGEKQLVRDIRKILESKY